jgi:RimJ/RimL family protein N-acetyltransferase
MNAVLRNVTDLPGGLSSLEDERMRHYVQLTTVDDAPGKQGGTSGMPRAGVFRGHLRVREAAAEERKGLDGLFMERDRIRWVEQALRTDRSWALVVERFENRKWAAAGLAIVDAAGQMAFGLFPRYRGQCLSSTAIRAVLQYLREYALTVITAQIGNTERSAARAFEQAGFVLSRESVSTGRVECLYRFVIRGECMPFNVWI